MPSPSNCDRVVAALDASFVGRSQFKAFPTKEMPSHKRARKCRFVVDYRKVNARVKRSTHCWRRSTDVLAASVYIYIGSVWYSFVDAVSGFNQIRNTKRAREVLTIVARSGTYLPIGSRSAQSVGPTTSTTLLIGPMPFEGGRVGRIC